jgi:CheY-like chemotaxis protein
LRFYAAPLCTSIMAKLILIADDDDDDVKACKDVLKRVGVNNPLLRVRDGEDVICYLKGEGKYEDRKKFPLPCVLLLDLKMARIGGFGVLEWLKPQKEFGDILTVVLSGHNDLENVRRAYQLGARSFLMKPCHPQDVQNLMRAYSRYWETDNAAVLQK